MKRHLTRAAMMAAIAALAVSARAGIPIPDAVLYGWVFIGGELQVDDPLPQNWVTVIARVDGVANPVGSCRVGGAPLGGDRYVLQIHLEFPVEGIRQSDDAAQVGQTVKIYVKRGAEPEQYIADADFVVPVMGHVERRDLGAHLACDWNCDTRIAVDDFVHFAECIKGPGETTTSQCLAVFDVDRDEDVDLDDYGQFQGAFTGS